MMMMMMMMMMMKPAPGPYKGTVVKSSCCGSSEHERKHLHFGPVVCWPAGFHQSVSEISLRVHHDLINQSVGIMTHCIRRRLLIIVATMGFAKVCKHPYGIVIDTWKFFPVSRLIEWLID
jgi:hypothetical protein